MTGTPTSSTLPWRRSAEQVADGLRSWARTWRGPTAEVSNVRSPGSGMANDTVLFDLDGDPLVARLAPAPDAPYPTFPTFDLELQQSVIDLVRRRTAVPVPEVVHLERSTEWLGVPFLVTRAIEGEVAGDNPPYLLDPSGWVRQGTPEQRQRLETSTIEVLAQIHEIVDDGDQTRFLHPGTSGETALSRHLASMRAYYDWARDGMSIPILDRAVEVLTATMPTTERSVVNWGDSRPGNIIYRDFEPVAVLDWEMAGVGPPELDVAWATFFQRFWVFMGGAYGASELPEMFGRETTVATYERLSGVRLDDLTWYEAAAGLRFGVILLRMSHRSLAFGMAQPPADPDDHVMFGPLLAQLLDELQP
jgi:aminoglycoside phosphotransferase (APT) family kinase protein